MLLIPVTILLGLICATVGLCGYVFVTLRREIQGVRKQNRAALDQIQVLCLKVARLHQDMESMPMLEAPSIPAAGINLNKRSQALRMLRTGEVAEHVATALSLPKNEVALLIKVQRLLLDSTD